MNGLPSPGRTETGPTGPLAGARTALALLLIINLFNYIDRQVLAAVEPEIRQELFPDDIDRGKDWTGWLSTAFLLSYMIISPIFGFLADRTSRWRLVGIGVILWEVIRSFEYAQTCAVLLMIVVAVTLIDLASSRLRKLFI